MVDPITGERTQRNRLYFNARLFSDIPEVGQHRMLVDHEVEHLVLGPLIKECLESDEQGRNLGLLYTDPGVYAVEEFLVDARLAMERGRGVRYVQALSEWFDREVALGRYESGQSLGTADIVALYHFDAILGHYNVRNVNIAGIINRVESQIPTYILEYEVQTIKNTFSEYLQNPKDFGDILQIGPIVNDIQGIRIS